MPGIQIRLSQNAIEPFARLTPSARVGGSAIEAFQAYSDPTPPSGSFGAAVSQDVLEVFMALTPTAHVGAHAVEVFIASDGGTGIGTGGGGGAGTISHGWS